MIKSRILYVIFLILTFISSQTMPHRLTSVLFITALILPVFSFIHAFIGIFSIKCYMENEVFVSERKTPMNIAMKIANKSILPTPFISVNVLMPGSEKDEMVNKKIFLSLNPRKSIVINNDFIKAYIGTYKCGIYFAEVTDLFKIIRFRIPVSTFGEVKIIPKSVLVNNFVNSEKIQNYKTITRYTDFNEDNEIADVRQYIDGDNLKRVHWKLSSKTENLFTKIFEEDSKNTVTVIPDLNFYYDDIDDNLESTNSVIEISLAFASKMISINKKCNVFWDDMIEGKSSIYVDSIYMFDKFYDMISDVTFDKPRSPILNLINKHIESTENGSNVYIITSGMPDFVVDRLVDISRTTNHILNIITFNKDVDTLNRLHGVFASAGISLWNITSEDMEEKSINLIPYTTNI